MITCAAGFDEQGFAECDDGIDAVVAVVEDEFTALGERSHVLAVKEEFGARTIVERDAIVCAMTDCEGTFVRFGDVEVLVEAYRFYWWLP